MSDFTWKCAESRRTQAARRKKERAEREEEELTLIKALDDGLDIPIPAILQQANGDDGFQQQLTVSTECMGIVIGKKGIHVKQIQEKHKVMISIKEDSSDSSKHTVTVSGKSRTAVAEAVKELDVIVERMSVPGDMTRWLCGKGAQHLRFLRDLTGVPVLTFCREEAPKPLPDEEKEEIAQESGPVFGYVEIKGDRESVLNAKLCLEAHMSYFPVAQEMEAMARQLDIVIPAALAELPDLPRSRVRAPKDVAELEEDEEEQEEVANTDHAPTDGASMKQVPTHPAASSNGKGTGQMRWARGRGNGRNDSTPIGAMRSP
mmetsp:Transcript_27754/g.61227  ORF Transcript_27754/g.61227 Transcript_27754/m.61227 type:complete len:318 (+) Transcript_27754:95-1048(+)